MIKKTTFIILLFILLMSNVKGSSISDLEKNKNKNKNKIQNIDEQIDNIKNEISKEQEEIEAIDRELNKIERMFINITEKYIQAEISLLTTQEELKEAMTKKKIQDEILRERLRYMYEHGNLGYVELILSSETVFDFFNRIEYINKIAEYDKKVYEELKKIEKIVELKEASENKQKNEIKEILAETKGTKEKLEEKYSYKKLFLSNLRAKEDSWLQEAEDLEKENKKIEKKIKEEEEKAKIALEKARLEGLEIRYKGGRLLWPVPSTNRITSSFGYRTHPISKVTMLHTGIDIGAYTGVKIVAAEAGIVTSAGYRGGYGNTVIINHGSGLSTLYAHNSSLTVKEGDIVAKGDQIAKAGSTGYSTGPHSHFEVRVNGVVENPINYLK